MLDPWKNPAIWHAINIHLPIVFAMVGLPIVCFLAITRGRSRLVRWGAFLFYSILTGSAWFAMKTGMAAKSALPTLTQAAADQIAFHQKLAQKVWWLAAATTAFLLLLNIPRRWARQTFTTLALVLSVTTAGWIVVTAHSGGLAVYEHGLGTVAMNTSAAPDVAAANVLNNGRGVAGPVASLVPGDQSAKTQTAVGIPAKLVSYTRDIRPLLSTKCAECHADGQFKGGFDVSSVAAILKGGKKSGAGLIAGKPDDSPLVQYIEGTKQPQMPKGGVKLSAADIAMIRQWIASGAVDDSTGSVATGSATKPVVVASAVVTPEVISPDWDPQVQFNADENVAVRRFVRLKNLKSAPAVPKVTGVVYNPVDQFIQAKWPATAVKPQATTTSTTASPATLPATQVAAPEPVDAAICDDASFARRVYVDLIGMIPTAADARAFIADKDPKKRDKLVDALLGRSKDYAGNWVPFWEEALCSNGLHQGGVGTHGNYREWIVSNFTANKPFDTMVQELLDPTMPNHPPRYVLNDNHLRTVQSSADTAQVFLGTAIKCASCHSHFLNDEWPQSRAVAFAGFFADKDLELIRCERKSGQFVATHFMFDLPAAPTTAPADQNTRLHEVAQLITDPTNPRFAKTMINRLWKRYLGLGLFEPADDYREDTPPSHPELLDWLADDFVRHGFDVKREIRLILTSRTYQLRYDPALEDHFDVAKPKAPRFYRSPGLRRLTEEQMLDSIDVVMKQQAPEKRAYQNDESSPLTRALGKPPVRNEVSTARPDDTAVVQSLEFLNGTEFHDRVYKGDLVTNSSVQPKVDELIDNVYWATLGRGPADKEKEAATAFLKSAPPPATTQPIEIVYLEDAIPPSATAQGPWKFVNAPAAPVFSGKQSHTLDEPLPPGTNQHLVVGLDFPLMPTDVLFAYVYIDPANPPKQIMLQFLTGGDWQRVSWGSDDIVFEKQKYPQKKRGDLPKVGEWVRLEIPASDLGVKNPGKLTGLAFTQFNGKVYWDKSGVTKGPPIHDPEAIGDMLWALFASPEFQYIK